MNMVYKIKQFAYRMAYGPKNTSAEYIEYLRGLGMLIGEYTTFYDPKTANVDITRPFLIDIGSCVQITAGFTLLTHGADSMVLERCFGEVLGSAGKVKIGNNCFIGMNTTVLGGVTIGNNVVIGANSLVSKDIPDNCVAVGNPARVIRSVGEHFESRKRQQTAEAKMLAVEYYERTKMLPDQNIMREFFWLYEPRVKRNLWRYDAFLKQTGNADEVTEKFLSSEPVYNGLDEMLKDFGLPVTSE